MDWQRGLRGAMHVIAIKKLRGFWEVYADSEQPLKSWYHEVSSTVWASSAGLKAMYGSASIVGNQRVVFNICGNKYRLVVKIDYRCQLVFVRFIGTHKQYDAIENILEV